MSENQQSYEQLPKRQVHALFGYHDSHTLPNRAANDRLVFNQNLENPKPVWDPTTVDNALRLNTGVICIDGRGAIPDNIPQKQEILRILLLELIPFFGSRDELVQLRADAVVDSQISKIGGVRNDLELFNEYRQRMLQETRQSRVQERSSFVVAAVALVVLHELLNRRDVGGDRKNTGMSMSRRAFLKGVGAGVVAFSTGYTGSKIADVLSNVGSFNGNIAPITSAIANILDPHFQARPIVEGRTALVHTVCSAYANTSYEDTLMIMGLTHRHLYDRISRSREYRVELIRGLYEALVSFIGSVSELMQNDMSSLEVGSLVKTLLTNQQVARVKKPKPGERDLCFDNPEQFFQVSPLGDVPEIQQALGL